MNPYLKQYQNNKVSTASPEQLLIILYDAAVAFMNKALVAMENKQIQELHNNIIKAQNIILEFINSLDFDVNKEIAENLKTLYVYIYELLVQANMEKDIEKLKTALEHVKSLRDTWKDAIKNAQAEISKIDFSSTSDEKIESFEESVDYEL